jgi:hypothetical protein
MTMCKYGKDIFFPNFTLIFFSGGHKSVTISVVHLKLISSDPDLAFSLNSDPEPESYLDMACFQKGI